MKKSVFFLVSCLLCYGVQAQDENIRTIKGKVTHLNNPVANAEISSEKFEVSAKTNTEGAYSIQTKEGDLIKFAYPGLKDMEIVVEDVTSILNVKMNEAVTQLDEVVVEKTKFKTQNELRGEYAVNKNLINTAFGIVDRDVTNYSLRIVDGSDLVYGGIDFVSALQFRFPNVRVQRSPSKPLNPVVYLRGNGIGFFPAIYDVDGMIFTEAPTFIQVENIERMAVMAGLGLVNKYGGKANGGVIVINTKGANYFPEPGTSLPYDQAKLRNNIFENDVLSKEQTTKDKPNYVQALYNASNKEEAKNIYVEQSKKYRGSYYFLLDNYEYFLNRWGDVDFADRIIKDHWYVFQNNPLALKALAYHYEVEERFNEANEVYKMVFILRPQYAQSYRDLALSYRDVKEYRKAAALYARYDYLVGEGFIRALDEGFTPVIRREFQNLLRLHGSQLGVQKRTYRQKNKDFEGTRLVFEWNDSEAEFELQFVNPENHYYNWEHSILASTERIKDEKLKGYSCEEYLIDNSLKGNWQVNVKYMGNKRLTPSFLKATIYSNYGTSSQRKQSKVFKLSLKEVKQQMLTLTTSGSVESK
jgi:tetratricopeptide (TPR) repeat protein